MPCSDIYDVIISMYEVLYETRADIVQMYLFRIGIKCPLFAVRSGSNSGMHAEGVIDGKAIELNR